MSADRPNILLVVFDTARADALEPYGAPFGSTPAIADLASAGTAVETLYATSSWTLPSHASLFTGSLPRSIGLGRSGTPAEALERRAQWLLPAVLRAAGYATEAWSANPWISPVHGFDAGFDRFTDVRSRRHAPDRGVRSRLRWLRDAAVADLDDGMREIDAAMRARMCGELPTDQPFFWFVNLMECHSPYLPPRPHSGLGLLGRLRAWDEARKYESHRAVLDYTLGRTEIPERALTRMRELYARSVRSMDDWLARVLEDLDAAGLLDDTVVIVTSDHGENFGEGHRVGHILSLDDRLVRIPLVAAGPGVKPEPLGTGAASLAAVPRWVAGLADIVEDGWHGPEASAGVAIAQLDGMRATWPGMADRLAAAWGISADALSRLDEAMSCATDGRWKLVRSGPREMLYDLAADPLEERDVADAHPAEVARLRAALDSCEAPRPQGNAATPQAPPSADVDDLEDRLRLLGYM